MSRSFSNARVVARNLNATSATTSNTHPPRLTDEERHLLHEHEGCLKCREFYIGHHANVCMVTLSGNGYKTCTLQDALRAKATSGSSHSAALPQPVAATTKTTPAAKTTKLVVAVFPQNMHVSVDSSAADDSDSSIASISDAPPLKGKHFIWKCRVDNPADCISVKARALIDSGAHMVLIRPDLVTRLNLASHPLKKPEQVNVALGSADQITQLTHFVIISLSSLDLCFRLKPLHTVIAPGLCMPIILGLPFLCINRITCNYAERTCLVTTMIPQYNLLNVSHERNQIPPLDTTLPDILASLKECATSTPIDGELTSCETKLSKRICLYF